MSNRDTIHVFLITSTLPESRPNSRDNWKNAQLSENLDDGHMRTNIGLPPPHTHTKTLRCIHVNKESEAYRCQEILSFVFMHSRGITMPYVVHRSYRLLPLLPQDLTVFSTRSLKEKEYTCRLKL